MNDDYQEWYKNHHKEVGRFWTTVQVNDENKATYLVSLLLEAISNKAEDRINFLIDTAFEIENELIQIAALNELLVIKEHQRHQEITKSLQNFAHPSSVDYIKTVLEGSFDHLDYNCSDSDVIAKWFSHALSRIGTEDAIDIIKKYANSSDEGIKHEMQYRLDKIKT